jgi:hypothetical protein
MRDLPLIAPFVDIEDGELAPFVGVDVKVDRVLRDVSLAADNS